MLQSELEVLMTKLHAGMLGMGDYEAELAYRLYRAAKDYRDAIEEVKSGRVNPDTRIARKWKDDIR